MSEYRNSQRSVLVHGPAQIGDAIRRFREEQGLDQATLADMADLHRTYLSKLETDTPSDTLGRILRLLHALDLELVIRPRGHT